MKAKEDLIEFIHESKNSPENKLAILCVGNDLRGDDGIGPLIANRLKEHLGEKEIILDVGSVPQNFLSYIARNKITHCLLIDAVEFDTNIGTVGLFNPLDLQEYQVTFSTHFIPMKVFIDLWIKDTGATFRILGIQPKSLEFGEPMNEEMIFAGENVVKLLISILNTN